MQPFDPFAKLVDQIWSGPGNSEIKSDVAKIIYSVCNQGISLLALCGAGRLSVARF